MMKQRVRILCAGMPRSGSTWQYNAVRILLRRAGRDFYGAWFRNYDHENPSPYHVIKTHYFHPSLIQEGALVLTSRRDLRDIAASLILRGWHTPSTVIAPLERAVADHLRLLPATVHETVYERFRRSEVRELAEISSALGISLEPDVLGEVSREINGLTHDPQVAPSLSATQLHPNHIMHGGSGYFSEVLPVSLVQRIERVFFDWLRRFGYLEADDALSGGLAVQVADAVFCTYSHAANGIWRAARFLSRLQSSCREAA